jgi:hypothetical protein
MTSPGQDKRLNLEGELTPQETLSALKLMKNGKFLIFLQY